MSHKGIKVGRAMIEIIEKLTPPISLKAIRSVVGHAGFYRRFIKDFSKISRLFAKLLEKYVHFNFDQGYLNVFYVLKEKVTNALIMIVQIITFPLN